VARRVRNSQTASLAAAKKNKAPETGRVGHRFEITKIGVKRQVFDARIR
jgi:hypothetical protein